MVSEKSAVPAPSNSDEKEFHIGDELTVFEGAMIYAGRHPHSQFLRDGNVEDYLKFLRAGFPEREPASRIGARARLSWDIFCDITQRIEQGRIEPVRRAYDATGQLDYVRTVIRTSDLKHLAAERKEQPKYLRHLRFAETLLAPVRQEQSVSRRKRQKPQLERAQDALNAIYPKGIPNQKALQNAVLCKEVGEWLKARGLRHVSDKTIKRAAGRRK
jgi:hypothetical protein